jgi:hypothetical protein
MFNIKHNILLISKSISIFFLYLYNHWLYLLNNFVKSKLILKNKCNTIITELKMINVYIFFNFFMLSVELIKISVIISHINQSLIYLI